MSDASSAGGVAGKSPSTSSTTRRAGLSPEELDEIVRDPMTLELRDDAAERVAELPPQTFAMVLRQLRDEGRLDLVLPYATPDQLTTVLDLEAWQRDRVDVLTARTFFTEIVNAYEHAPHIERGDLVELMYSMDPEMWTLALHAGTAILELDPEDDELRDRARRAVEDRMMTLDTPDGVFLIAAPDNAAGRQALRIIERVYGDSLQDGRALVNRIRAALTGPIEEQLYQFRAGRLMDLGFVPWEEAMRLFKPLPIKVALHRDGEHAPGLRDELESPALFRIERGVLLARVLQRLDEATHGVRLREFTVLVNEVMSAQRMNLGDAAAQEHAVRQTQATLSLGLEQLAHAIADERDADAELEDELAALIALDRLSLREVFRVGYGPLFKLRAAANALHREGRVSLDRVGSLLDRPWGPSIAALAAWFPELPLEDAATKTRPLASLRDVSRATARVAEAGALAALTFETRGYGVDAVWLSRLDEPGRLTLGDLVRTVLVLEHTSERPDDPQARLPAPDLTPLTRERLVDARARLLLRDGQLAPAARAGFLARARRLGLEDHADALADNVLTRLAVELAALEFTEDGELDMTRVGGVITVQHVGVWLRTGLKAT